MSFINRVNNIDSIFFNEFYPYIIQFKDFDYDTLEGLARMNLLPKDKLVEWAISSVSGLEIHSEKGKDFSDNSDCKTVVSQARITGSSKYARWTNSFKVSNISSKIGALRVVAYNKVPEKFHYFYIPNQAFKSCKNCLEINIEQVSLKQEPNYCFNGIRTRDFKWWNFECSSFEELCKIK